MNKFQLKLKGIIDGTYTIPQEDISLEQRLWDRFYDADKLELTEEEKDKIEKYKEYQRNYHREYYRRKLAKGKKPQQQTTSAGTKSRVKKYNSKVCIYQGSEVKFGTLVQRLFKLYGSYPQATAEAKKYIRQS